MILLKKIILYSLVLTFFCANRCSIEGTSLHFFNKSSTDVVLMSKEEIINFRNGFLNEKLYKERTIDKKQDNYIGFTEHELSNFSDTKENFMFYILDLQNIYLNKFVVLDSIKVNSKKISFLKSENCIIYNKNLTFTNKNLD